MPDNNEKKPDVVQASGTDQGAEKKNSQPGRRGGRRRIPAAARISPENSSGQPQLAEQAKPELVEELLRENGTAKPVQVQKESQPQQKIKPQPVQPVQQATVPRRQNPRRHTSTPKNTQTPTPVKPAPVAAAPAAQPVAAVAVQPAAVHKSNRGRRPGGSKKQNKPQLRIIPLGGLGEVGKNITVYECGTDSFIVDCGLTFPDEGMPGVDLVIPDFSYVLENRDKIKGIVITHGHEDHVGSIPYLLKHVNLPLYGTKLTLGLVEGKLKEHGLLNQAKLNIVKSGDIVNFGCMNVEFINVNHSIPDACALAIHTPAGIVVQTGDFKIDFTPIRGDVINLARFGELGSKGVLALLSDSTNAERPGSTQSERTVGESFDKLFASYSQKRIIVATFASNVHRIQQIVDAAVKYKRKVAVSGRSMENVVNKALEIGYLDIPSGVLVDIDSVDKYTGDKMVIITTGSQGEPMSALTRMAMGDHRKLTVTTGDCIIISATPIPGNEKLVTRVVNELLKLGAEVVYEKMYEIHVSGHACQDELKMMIALTKPKFFIPMHGEYKHLKHHAELARSMGIDSKNILLGDIGKVMELDSDAIRFNGVVTAGKVLVDGLGVGDVGSIVLRDRKHLAQDGLIVVVASIDLETGQLVSGPDIVSRGFVYVRESEDMIGKARDIARTCIQKCIDANTREWGVIKQRVRDDVGDYVWQTTKRNPMILPVIQEI